MLNVVGDAKVEWRWLMVRKIVVMIIEESMILEGTYREEAGRAKANSLKSA